MSSKMSAKKPLLLQKGQANYLSFHGVSNMSVISEKIRGIDVSDVLIQCSVPTAQLNAFRLSKRREENRAECKLHDPFPFN